MPSRKRTSGVAPKSQQSTLAFHGASNKVTKPNTRFQGAKKNLITPAKVQVIQSEVEERTEEAPTTAEAAIIEQTEQEIEAQQVESTPDEDAARRISDAAIKRYWATKEKQRMAPRVHQEHLNINEKILREFDMSAHYGPCIGIARLKRWKRAQRLNLQPPLEVLAVLLKEQEQSADKVTVQKSIADDLLNTKVDVEAH